MKKFMAMTMAMVMAAMALTGCGGSDAADDKASGDIPVIGINQYGQHASLDNCREGFLQGLEEAGLKEGVDYKIEYQALMTTPQHRLHRTSLQRMLR